MKIIELKIPQKNQVGEAVRTFAQDRNIKHSAGNDFDALLILEPTDSFGWSTTSLIEMCREAGKPYFVTDGIRFTKIHNWLDSLQDEFPKLRLGVAGPGVEHSAKASNLTGLALNKLFIKK